jgi:hypothetical protein
MFIVILILIQVSFIYGIDLATGIDIHYSPYFLRSVSDETVPAKGTSTIVGMTHDMGFSLFFDATYIRVDIEYTFTGASSGTVILDFPTIPFNSVTTTPISNYSNMALNFSVLGKYPIKVETINVWPAFGTEFSLILWRDSDGDGKSDLTSSDAPHDFFLLGGFGVDFVLAEHFVFTPNFIVGINLTPHPLVKTSTSDPEYSGYKLKIGLSTSYRF